MKSSEDWSGHSKLSLNAEGTVLKHGEIETKSEKKQQIQHRKYNLYFGKKTNWKIRKKSSRT